MTKYPKVPDGFVLCPLCDGDHTRYLSGPSWGYWGGSDVEYSECPTCEGVGYIADPDAEPTTDTGDEAE